MIFMKVFNLFEDFKLKQIQQCDAQGIFDLIDSQREYLGKWLPFVVSTKTVVDTEAFVNSVLIEDNEINNYVFVIQKVDEIIGLIGLKDINNTNKKAEIGYWLSEQYQGKGIMTQSARCLCRFIFNDLNINRIQIKCATLNFPSKNIPKRLGFQLEGIEREGELLSDSTFTDLEIYSLLKSDILV